MEQLIDTAARIGWPAAVTVAMLFAFAVAWRRWKREDRQEQELKDAEVKYKEAVASGDPDRISIAARRLSDARSRCP